ncbi:hypothetical protein J2Y69_001642 [Microbacterium resistens]|uniref:PDGLE domain-containing protein n=1 Tax=Microbacterium resistens TaxID=156977 RepID=A0ABU1SBR5_9MICO|nr:hypothetical protein [Microbacterium resistens]MDR6867043.1 hypothetical protein [Microbacterium resistens]
MIERTRPARAGRLRRLDRSDIGFFACFVGPLGVGVLLNGLVRPSLAHDLDGIRHAHGASVRGSDVYWEFDAATQAAHPFLTGFLETSDGVVGMCALGLVVVLLLGRWALRRLRSRPE